MKVFVFKPSNQLIGKFEVSSLEMSELEEGFREFSKRQEVGAYDYLEASGKTWTVVDEEGGLGLQEGLLPPKEANRQRVDAGPPTLESRYHRQYERAGFALNCGGILMFLAIVVGVVILCLTLSDRVLLSTGVSFFHALFAAAAAGIPIFIAGVVVRALGDIQRASLDTAVQASPYLSEEERERLIRESGD